MLIGLNEEQSLLVDSAKAFLSGRVNDGLEAAGPDRIAAWREMAGLGWTTVIHEAESGGLCASVLLCEQMGYYLNRAPFVDAAVTVPVLLQALPGAQATDVLAAQLGSEPRPLALAFCEGSGEWSPKTLGKSLAEDGKLSVEKRFVSAADLAGAMLVVAKDTANELVLLHAKPSDYEVEAMGTLSGEALHAVRFNWQVPECAVLCRGAALSTALEHALACGAVAHAAIGVGAAQHALDLCVEHAQFREQSGRPIGAFQAIQHHLADMLRDVEGARWMVYRAAWQLDNPTARGLGSEWRDDAAMAKAYAGSACLAAVRKAHQVMGAIGYCDEHLLHWLHKQVHAASVAYGSSDAHLDAIIERI